MKLWVYTIAFNEAPFVKKFLSAYAAAEKIIIYDNMSTDNTVSLLKEDPRVEVRINDSGGQIRDDIYLEIKNNCWKEARGKADWVIICDFDEIFARAIQLSSFGDGDYFDIDMTHNWNISSNYKIIKPSGYMIYAISMPEDINPLRLKLRGVYDVNSEKLCCFRPDQIGEINYSTGCHDAKPVDMKGNQVHSSDIFVNPVFKLLHFKYVDIKVYFRKLSEYQKRMSEYNLIHGYGMHYTWPAEKHWEIYMKGLTESQPIFEIKTIDHA